MKALNPYDMGWHLGFSTGWKSKPLWGRWDRTCGVLGPQGSGKSLDLLLGNFMNAPGAAMITLTKPSDLLLTLSSRLRDGRPIVVLDPYNLVPGLPRLVPDMIRGCENPIVAERRASRFTKAAMSGQGRDDPAAKFYQERSSLVLMCYFHAAALSGKTMQSVMEWVARGAAAEEPHQLLLTNAGAALGWAPLLSEALSGDDRTVGNTLATLQGAVRMFIQPEVLQRCVPSIEHPATDIAEIIQQHGTFYLLGRDDPHVSVAPLMTAVCEEILDTALELGQRSRHGRLTPPLCCTLDELPSVAPIPSLITRMANERALGIHFTWGAQTKRQLVARYGEQEANALIGLTNTLVVFGGNKDPQFLQDTSTLVGSYYEHKMSSTTHSSSMSMTSTPEKRPRMEPSDIARIPARHALVFGENTTPMIVRMRRCIDGKEGKKLLEYQDAFRAAIYAAAQQEEAACPA